MGRALRIGNPPIEVDLRRSARARRLSLRVSRLDGKVTLTMPPRAPERQAIDFLTEREDWLRGHLDDIRPAVTAGPGKALPYLGRDITVQVADVRSVTVRDDLLLLPPGAGAPAIRAYLKARARDRLAAASDHYAGLIGRSYTKLTLRDTRSRWGSCTSTGGLMYSWRLIMAPPAVLDYVAAHEVAHLEQMNHSDAFWAIVARLDPNFAVHRRWLRDHGDRLHAVRFDTE
ncbi:zinc metalloprotease [Loktanella sp. 3ANDIMAR09]|uniref:M48 family metallopeptidase n=1 Tax=Loktanella sp. 3ANDIMAR09 TaxID=1225657 RepID=UPI0007003EC0|nr:SprT family zinc-dependent metalloprotease [Loktanella sp. 3ANDIMAR09]KQI69031.1 zinc metalloprotease [Loktanella sp. 3ANDIMAR09]